MVTNRIELSVWFLLLLLAGTAIVQSQADLNQQLAQELESRTEQATDYNILQARLKNNVAEYTLGNFCASAFIERMAEPSRAARRSYCAQKATDYNTRDADLKDQMQKLALSVQQLDAKIADTRRALTASQRRP